jgi:hypothetical protein
MAIKIGNYNFEGPHENTAAVHARSGVYVILGRNGGQPWFVVDVGESSNVRARLDTHDRAGCWQQRGYGKLAAAVTYVPEPRRMAIEQELRSRYNPPCGYR